MMRSILLVTVAVLSCLALGGCSGDSGTPPIAAPADGDLTAATAVGPAARTYRGESADSESATIAIDAAGVARISFLKHMNPSPPGTAYDVSDDFLWGTIPGPGTYSLVVQTRSSTDGSGNPISDGCSGELVINADQTFSLTLRISAMAWPSGATSAQMTSETVTYTGTVVANG